MPAFVRAVVTRHSHGSQSNAQRRPSLSPPNGASEASRAQSPRLADFRIEDKTRLMSMVVIRGAVRACDIGIICLVGFAVAAFYVDEPVVIGSTYYIDRHRHDGGRRPSPASTCSASTRTRDFTSFIRQMPRVLLAWTAAFALLLAGVFFFKAGHEFSRVWFAAWYAAGIVVIAGRAPRGRQLRAPLDAAGPPLSPRRDLRRRRHLREADPRARGRRRQRRPHHRHLRRPRRRPRRSRHRRLPAPRRPEAARRRRPHFAPRPRHRRAADHRREARARGDARTRRPAGRGQAAGPRHASCASRPAPTRASATSP